MNKRGFTLIELISCFVILALLGTIGLISYKSVMEKSEETYYKTMEQNLLLSGNEYYNDHRGEKPINSYSKVSVSNLISNNYIEQLKDKSGNNCSRGDVFIYQQENGNYEYEVCLECGDYISEGTYCSGNIPGEISILSKLKSNNNDYNSLLGYSNVEWINSDSVMMTFTNTDNVDKYVIVNIDNNETLECNVLNHENNSCSIEIDETGSYKVIAYSDDEIIGHEKTFNVKIDNNNPSFDIDMSNKNVIKDGTNKMDVPIVIKNIKDDSGIQSVEYRIGNTGDYTVLGNEKEYSFNENLESGVYQLEVVVTDLSGKKTRKTVDFVVSYLIDLQYSVTKIEQFEVVKGQKYSYLDTLPTDYEGKDATWYRQDDVSIEVDNNSIVNLDHKHTLILKTLNSVDTPNSSFCKSNLKYNGSVQTLTNNPGNGYTFNNNTAQEVGEYIVIATLDSGYIWNDGTTDDKTFTCKIENSGQVCYWESVEVKGCTTSITTVKPTSPKKGDIYISSCVKTSEYYTVTGGTMICVNSIGKSITKTVNSSQVHKSTSSEATAYCQSLLNCPAGTTHSAIAGQCEPVYVLEYKYTKYTYICNKTAADLTKTLSENTYEYDGTSHTPTVTIKDGDKTLVKDVDYTVIYKDNVEVGTGKVEITYIGDYQDLGSETLEFTIIAKKVDIPTANNYCKTGLAYAGTLMTITKAEGEGYTFSGNSKTNAGEYTVTATLSSKYQWSDNTTEPKTFKCSIAKAPLTITVVDKTISYGETPSYSYTVSGLKGSDTQASVVTGNVTYTIKNSSGTVVTIGSTTGLGEYTIVPSGLTIGNNYSVNYVNGALKIIKSDTTTSLSAITKTYNGSSQAASGATSKLSSNNSAISEGSYSYKYYSNNTCTSGETTTAPTNAGTYYVKATLEGTTNYNSSPSSCVKYTMNPYDISESIVSGLNAKDYTGSAITQAPTVKVGTTTLVNNTDYTYAITNNTNVGTATVTVTGKGNYTGTKTATFTINKVPCTVTAPTKKTGLTYNGGNQALVTGGTCTGGTMQYATSETGTYSTAVPTGTNAESSYAVWYYCKGDSNHTDTIKTGLTSISIGKKSATVTAVNQTISYGSTITNDVSKATLTNAVSGHVLTAITLTSNASNGTITPSGATIKVTNESGTDVTSNYAITYVNGTLTITDPTKPVVTITRSDYNTFTYSATDNVGVTGYYISTTNTIPTTSSTWVTTTTKDVSTTAKETWYVWARDAEGNISDAKSITNYHVTKTQGTGTTLTLKADNNTEINTSYVLAGTSINVTASLSTGYSNLSIKKDSTAISSGTSHTISEDTTFTTSAIEEDVSLLDATVTINPSTFYYDGLAKTPNVTVTLGGETLTLNKDYTVSYKDNVNVGEGTVTITGIGDYTGTIEKHFSINPCSIVGATVVLSEDTFYHDNNPKTPTITVTLDGKVLTLDKDYTVTYKDNTDVGEGTVTITGIGNYTGIIDEHFSINLYPIADATVVLSEDNFYYDSNPKTPTVMVTLDGKVLTLDKDYAVTYKDNVNVGEGTVTITGIGDYTGTIEKHLSISYCEYTVNFYTYDGVTKYGSLIINGYQTKVLTTINALGGIAPISGGLFQGWAETANSTTVKYADGENVNLTGTCPTNRIINLYAIWKNDEKNYSVTFDLNDYPSMTYNGSTYTSSTTISCSVPATYNNNSQATSCLIEAPIVTTSEYDVMKWENSSNPTVTAPTISYIGGYIPATSEIVTLYANGYYGCKNGTTLSNFITKVSSGDGFWADPWSSGRYIYRGLNPDNHIEFNGDSTNWRIMSIESDGTIGIVYTGKNISQKWNSANSGVWKDSTLYTYLNGTYYDSLSTDAKNMLVNHDWKTGYDSITDKTYTIADLQTVEESTNATGNVSSKVGLMRITDYLKASSYITETDNWKDNFYGGSSTRKYPQKTDNWLYDTTLTSSQGIWLLNKANGTNVRYIQNVGTFYINYLSTSYIVKPVVFLKADVLLRGTGTESNPYRTSTSCTSVQTSPATCNITTSTTYEESKTLSISVTNNGVTVNEYSWDGINWVSSNSKSGIQLVGSYSGFIKDSNGDTNSCTPVNIVSRQEYQHETCIESRGCSGYTCSQYEYDFQLCDTNCYRSSLPSYSTSQLCRGQNHYWNSCTNSCYNYLASASYYSYNSLQSGDSNFTQGLSWCGCKTYDTSDQTWYTESKGISTTSKVKDAATRTTYAKAS